MLVSLPLTQSPAHAETVTEMLLAVELNGKDQSEPMRVLKDGDYWLPRNFFTGSHLRIPPIPPRHLDGLEYYPVASITGARCKLDEERQVLSVTALPDAFEQTQVNLRPSDVGGAGVSETGFFLNHDIQATWSSGFKLSSILEGGAFGSFGVIRSEILFPDFAHTRRPIFLSNQLFKDFPSKLARLTIGDNISAPGEYNYSVYFTGISWSTEFATHPEFTPYPTPSISGSAVAPSSVDLYVDNVKRMTEQVEPGPFTLNNVPVISSEGNITLVVRDLMGREFVSSQSYVYSTNLLKPGTTDFSYELGTLRTGYGTYHDPYHSIFASVSRRRGLTKYITLNTRAEILPRSQDVGAGLDLALPKLGVLDFGGAESHGLGAGMGTLGYAGLTRSVKRFEASGRIQAATSSFRQLGLLPGQHSPTKILQAQASYLASSHLSFAAGYIQQQQNIGSNIKSVLVSSTVRTGRWTFLFSATAPLMPGSPAIFSVNLIRPLSEDKYLQASAERVRPTSDSMVELDKQLPSSYGYGYRIRESQDGSVAGNVDAEVQYQDRRGLSTAELDRESGVNNFRFAHRGGLVFVKHHLLATRWLDSSFGVVQIGEIPGIPVYANNQLIGTTDGHGLAVVPSLVPYARNTIRIDDNQIPLDFQADLSDRMVSPRDRSGVFVKFASTVSPQFLVKLVTEAGIPVPVGATVTVDGRPENYMVAMRGAVLLENLVKGANLKVTWTGGACSARLSGALPTGAVPELGPVVCRRESK